VLNRIRGVTARDMGIKGGPRKGTAGSREGSPGAPWPRCSSSCRADTVSCAGKGGGEALPGRCQVGGEGSRVAHESGGESRSTCFAAPGRFGGISAAVGSLAGRSDGQNSPCNNNCENSRKPASAGGSRSPAAANIERLATRALSALARCARGAAQRRRRGRSI
jgi:hypothetical protein